MRVFEEYGPQCFTAEVERTMSMLENDNAIIFTDTDMGVPYPDHRRSLYLEAQINDVFVRRALVDTRSSLNIVPLYVLKAAGIPQSRILPFHQSEAHYIEAQYFNEFTSDEGSTPSEVSGVPLPSWRDIRDLSDEDFSMMTEHARARNKESSACVQILPWCSKVLMPNGRTVYRL
ncbi:hypothetical protein M0R45_006789 [Rubus argutus]|uniref:Uncharacterized protein n=1 Tax=Rubus argutus TaxID=59490 RepID=A0AAW1YRR5_RUBAR